MTDETAPVDVTSLSPADSAKMLVEMSAAYAKANPAPDNLSPEEAGARLAAMTAEYHNANASKNTAADEAIVGVLPPAEFETTGGTRTTVRNKLDLIETLREIGTPEKGIQQIISGEGPDGTGYSKSDVEWAKSVKRAMIADPDIRALLLSGDIEAKRNLVAISQIIAVGVTEEKTK